MSSKTAKMKFSSKSGTLQSLFGELRSAIVLPQISFQRSEFKREIVEKRLRESSDPWLKGKVIVRSSASAEDHAGSSMAGKFLSIGGVKGLNEISDAFLKVATSLKDTHPDDRIFIQPYLHNVKMSGVAFSRDPNTGGHYAVINFDDSSGKTDSVTSGKSNLRTFHVFKKRKTLLSKDIQKVLECLTELENLFGSDVDLEWAIAKDEKIYLLQARPLTVSETGISLTAQEQCLSQLEKKIATLGSPHPYLHGKQGVFGIMPDWNPAEIIGVRPRPLSFSLYKEIITDQIWAYQRDNYGYKNLRSFPLIHSFAGQPYVDVRVSFNSFIPSSIKDTLADKLVEHYLKQLIDTPSFHDKVEFEIVLSCYTFDIDRRLKCLQDAGFTKSDCDALADALRTLTKQIINPKTGLWKKDREKIEILKQRREIILTSELEPLAKIYWLLEDCKRYGTLPFAGLARAAFIAVQFLRSMVIENIITLEESQKYLSSLNTVSSTMASDLRALSKEEFLLRYGHLRPGTYDILSPRYDEKPDAYLDFNEIRKEESFSRPSFSLSLPQLSKIENLLKAHSLDLDVLGIFDFLKEAIEGREYSKFIFTRNLSDAMRIYQQFGEKLGFTPEDLSFSNIGAIRELYSSSQDPVETLHRSVEAGKSAHALTKSVCLPPLIYKPSQVWEYETPATEPNFITLKKCQGPVRTADGAPTGLEGSVLFIKSADPGYDWIFTRGIAGFVTMYGGVNSHMAIRALELGVPAVIGAGNQFYEEWSKAKRIELDCANHQVKKLA